MNYRTVTRCQRARRVTRRMCQVLQEFRDSQDAGEDRPGIGGGDGAGESPHDLVIALERENRELRETVETQAQELEALRRASEQGERESPPGGQMRLEMARNSQESGTLPATLAQFLSAIDTKGPEPVVPTFRREQPKHSGTLLAEQIERQMRPRPPGRKY